MPSSTGAQARRSSGDQARRSSDDFTPSELREMQAGPFTSSELRAAAAEMQAETQADGEVGTAAQPSHHAQGSKSYLATHQPAVERALLLAVWPHVETRPRTGGHGTLCLLARLPGPKIIMAAG